MEFPMWAQAGCVIYGFRRSRLIQPFLQPFKRDEVVWGTWEGKTRRETSPYTSASLWYGRWYFIITLISMVLFKINRLSPLIKFPQYKFSNIWYSSPVHFSSWHCRFIAGHLVAEATWNWIRENNRSLGIQTINSKQQSTQSSKGSIFRLQSL